MFVVTGGGSGIGRALAQELASRGKQVLIIGRRLDALSETAKHSSRISIICADIASEQGRRAILAKLQDIQQLDGLVHNAAVIDPILPIRDTKPAIWEQAININLNAPLYLSQLLLAKLSQGRVLHIGSGAAYFPVSGWATYCVSKAALSMLTRCWQLESNNTAFASVMPGIIDTDMQTIIRHSNTMDCEKVAFFNRLKQENRLIKPTTVALFLVWLLLDVKKTDYVAKEWDIYDTSHHSFWLVKPHVIPYLE